MSADGTGELIYLGEQHQTSCVSTRPKVLILRRFGSIGDMLMMTPALKTLSHSCSIDIAVPSAYVDVFANLEFLHKIFSTEESIVQGEYERVLDLTDFEFNYEHIFQPLIEKDKVELFCDALNVQSSKKSPEIRLTQEEQSWVDQFLQEHGVAGRKIILVAIRAANPTRDWPLNRWQELIQRLKKLDYHIIVLDKDLHWKDDQISFFNNHSIRELFALVSKADFVLCNDSGILHVAAAFDKIVLGIFGPTDPKLRCIYKNSFGIANNIGLSPSWYERSSDAEYFKAITVEDVERMFLEVIQHDP